MDFSDSERHFYIKILVGMLTVIVVSSLALTRYFRQKEFELAKKRYLEEGLDQMAAGIEHSLSVFRHNYELTLGHLKEFRELGTGFNEKYLSDFMSIDHTLMSITATHRVKKLTHNGVIWDSYQNAFSFVGSANNFFRNDLMATIQGINIGDTQSDHDRQIITQGVIEEMLRFNDKSEQHYTFLSRLLQLASLLEQHDFSFKKIQKFHKQKDVKMIIKAIEDSFQIEEDELDEELAERGISRDDLMDPDRLAQIHIDKKGV